MRKVRTMRLDGIEAFVTVAQAATLEHLDQRQPFPC